MADKRQQDTHSRLTPSRRRVPTAAALAPALTGVPARACALSAGPEDRSPAEPVMAKPADWAAEGDALGPTGDLRRFMFHTGLPRRDLTALPRGIRINRALVLGTRVSYVRHPDHSTLLLGDTVVTERELQIFRCPPQDRRRRPCDPAPETGRHRLRQLPAARRLKGRPQR
ncbi:uncharacterized protein DUF1259 [Streptomyces sp. Ag82_O1-15]|uniref:DUF1259 domain-containing protein n=1 Tax=Streptomyces sp. Ag82_O1-15 TaxID=1938855 RepID=UPI000BC76653|nr:DUF1259 domain-containing protein [Streptomyces sp. Ag82_O1-15]PBC93150.1 uncharacterized protein DUF1259 [Streptomyces sp. Ag82_O1-15]